MDRRSYRSFADYLGFLSGSETALTATSKARILRLQQDGALPRPLGDIFAGAKRAPAGGDFAGQ